MTEQSAYVNRFLEALSSDGAASDRAAKMMLYGQFVGSWDLQVVDYEADGKRWEGVGEVHFGWVLEGRNSRCLDLPTTKPAENHLDNTQHLRHNATRLRPEHGCLAHSLDGSVKSSKAHFIGIRPDWSASTFKITLRWGSCTIASLADPTGLNLKPRARIFLAAFTSRSIVKPHFGQCSFRFSSGNIRLCPHIEHFTDVPCGLT